MIRDEQLFDNIEAYLRGKMTPAEAAAFEADMASDPELAALVQTHRLEREGLEWLVERDLRAKMSAWERDAGQMPMAAPMRVSFVRRWWAAGVAAALLIGIAGWWLLQPQADVGGPQPIVTAPTPAPKSIPPSKTSPRPNRTSPAPGAGKDDAGIAETTKPKPPATENPPAAVDYAALADTYYNEGDFMQQSPGGAADPSGYGQALDSYKSGKYADVEKLLKPAQKSDQNALKNKELLAHSLYRRGRYAEAGTYFRQLAGAKDKALAERSEWALALALLQQMPARRTELNTALSKIAAQPGHAFHDEAVALKKRLSL